MVWFNGLNTTKKLNLMRIFIRVALEELVDFKIDKMVLTLQKEIMLMPYVGFSAFISLRESI